MYELRNRTGITVGTTIGTIRRERIRSIVRSTNKKDLELELELLIRRRLGTIRKKRLRGVVRDTTVSAAPQNNIFREYIFIEVKLLPLTAPYSKPIPIPPSRPNDLKHIAIDY